MTIERDTPLPPPLRAKPFAGPAVSSAPLRPRRRSRLPWIGGAALILVLGLVAGVLLLGPRLGGASVAPATARPTAGPAVAPGSVAETVETTTLAPDEVRPITADEARAFNAGLPFSGLPIQAAKPFIMPADRLDDYARALDCLTAAVYYEAATETAAGQAAVAQVVINRMRHPAYPKTVCGVVFQGSERKTGCQFSFTCDGAMGRKPVPEAWERARRAATAALNGYVASSVGMATHYHTDWVAPYWAERLVKMRQIGTHIFYRWGGGWGLPTAFNGRHADVEPVIDKMAVVDAPLEGLALDDPSLSPAPVLVSVAPPSVTAGLNAPVAPVVAPPVAPRPAAPAPVSAIVAVPAPKPVAAPPQVARPSTDNPLNAGSDERQQRRRARIAAPS